MKILFLTIVSLCIGEQKKKIITLRIDVSLVPGLLVNYACDCFKVKELSILNLYFILKKSSFNFSNKPSQDYILYYANSEEVFAQTFD